MISSPECSEDLMKVHHKTMDKKEAFDKHYNLLSQHLVQSDVLEQ